LIVALTSLGGETPGGIPWAGIAGLFGLATAFMIAFIRHEWRAENPIIDVQILRGRPFMAANIFNVAFGFMFGTLTFLPLYTVAAYSASTLESGLFMTPRAIGMMATSIISSFLLVRWGYRKPMIIGTSVLALSLVLLGLEPKGVSLLSLTMGGTATMLVVMAISGIGQGTVMPAANNACLELMPDRISTITGLRATCRNIGTAIGLALASITLGGSSNLGRGFQFVYFGTALVVLMTIPSIFAMPRSPSDAPARPGRSPGRVFGRGRL